MYDRDRGFPADTDTRHAQTLTGVAGTLFERLNGCGPDDATITMLATDGATGIDVRDVLASYGLLDG